VMLLALMLLPETKGRIVSAITPGDMTSLQPAAAATRDGYA